MPGARWHGVGAVLMFWVIQRVSCGIDEHCSLIYAILNNISDSTSVNRAVSSSSCRFEFWRYLTIRRQWLPLDLEFARQTLALARV
jgi:hypothetical protein